MSESTAAGRAPAPWHLWVIGVIAVLWNSMGAFDYFMTQTHNAAHLASYSQVQLDYFFGLPAWVVACWAIGVWGGLLGSVLLLLRKGVAEWVFLASLVGAVLTPIYNFALSNGMEIMGGGAGTLIFPVVIVVVAVALYLYARAMRRRGVLA